MNSAYNQMALDKPSQRLTNFVTAGQQYCFKRLLYGISIDPAAFFSFMSSIFKPHFRKNQIISYLDDVFRSRYYNRQNVANTAIKIELSSKMKSCPR